MKIVNGTSTCVDWRLRKARAGDTGASRSCRVRGETKAHEPPRRAAVREGTAVREGVVAKAPSVGAPNASRGVSFERSAIGSGHEHAERYLRAVHP